jgi:hypothetical protein
METRNFINILKKPATGSYPELYEVFGVKHTKYSLCFMRATFSAHIIVLDVTLLIWPGLCQVVVLSTAGFL